MPPVRIEGVPPVSRSLLDVVGFVTSIALHAALFLFLVFGARRPAPIASQKPVEFEVVEKARPPPPPPEPPKPPEAPRKVEPSKVAKVKPPPPPKDAPPPPPKAEEAPPPPNEAPPPDAKPQAPVMIGISMSSTTTAGSFAAPVGNSLYGTAPRTASNPQQVAPLGLPPSAHYVPPHKVTRLPSVAADYVAPYPEEARKLGIEGQVILRLIVDEKGNVAKATILKGIRPDLDQTAIEAMKRFRFNPGTEGDEPVATEITYTYTFMLD